MSKQKKLPTLAKKVVVAWMVVLFISNLAIGTIAFLIYRGQLLETRAIDAQNVAIAMAVRVDGDKFTDIMATYEKNEYWHEVKEYADEIAVVFDTAFIYILDAVYTDEVTYFAEGAPGDAAFDLGMSEVIEDIYADEMFETIRTGVPSSTEPYPSGEYGDMVSGFAAITNDAGKVVGVVGVDFFYGDIVQRMFSFAMTLSLVIAGFMIFCYFTMTYLGVSLAGNPLTRLDESAKQLALGDMDVTLNIKSTTEIGRLADSFTKMIAGMKVQVDALEVLSHGDLTPAIEPRSDNDIMGLAIQKILSNLNEIFGEITQTAIQVSAGARQISDSAQSLAQGASEQANAVDTLSVSISDVTQKANENMEVAVKTNKLADSIKNDAQTGSEQMNKMTDAVRAISEASVSISKVIKVIDDIAFQTNILALNAAVEAARAGQHGKGFAVVAEEVRTLAAKSAEAAKDTERLISDSMEKAQLGAAIADETAKSLDRIIGGINEAVVLIGKIASSFEEQIKSIREINSGIEQVSRVVQQNSAAAEESASASEEMSSQSVVLEELVSQFKLKERERSLTAGTRSGKPKSLPPRSGK